MRKGLLLSSSSSSRNSRKRKKRKVRLIDVRKKAKIIEKKEKDKDAGDETTCSSNARRAHTNELENLKRIVKESAWCRPFFSLFACVVSI